MKKHPIRYHEAHSLEVIPEPGLHDQLPVFFDKRKKRKGILSSLFIKGHAFFADDRSVEHRVVWVDSVAGAVLLAERVILAAARFAVGSRRFRSDIIEPFGAIHLLLEFRVVPETLRLAPAHFAITTVAAYAHSFIVVTAVHPQVGRVNGVEFAMEICKSYSVHLLSEFGMANYRTLLESNH